jgi:hypothetical protein
MGFKGGQLMTFIAEEAPLNTVPFVVGQLAISSNKVGIVSKLILAITH